MPDANIIIPVVLHVIFLVTGLTGSLFILSVQLLDWLKTHLLTSIDLIIFSIGFIHFFLQGSFAFSKISYFLFEEFYIQVWVAKSLAVIMISLSFSSLWCSTTLCFYYYVKIINLNGTIFCKLRAKLPVIVPRLLVFSNVMSWIVGLPVFWDFNRPSPFPIDNATYVLSVYNLRFKSECDCLFRIYMALSTVAFTIILFTAGAIIKSLHRHMTQIKKSNKGVSHRRLSAHKSAARTIISLLIVYLVFYGIINTIFIEVQDAQSVTFVVSFIVLSSFPTVNTVILIFGNRKLSNKLRYVIGAKLITGKTEVSVIT